MNETPHDKELALLEKAQGGDREALDQLLRAHEKDVYRFGLRMCGDEEAAREVLQQTLLTAFQRLNSFRGEARLSTWLYAIARSFCSRAHRRGRSAPTHDVSLDAGQGEPTLEAAESTPADSSERAEMAQLVAVAIGLLPPQQREVVVLRDVEGLSLEEAAEVVGLQLPALKSRLHRARELLKRHLATLLRDREGVIGNARACPKLAHELAAMHGGPLDQSACVAIEKHIAECETCAKALGDLRQAASLCRHLPQGDVPEPVKRAVRAAMLEALPPHTDLQGISQES